MPVVYRFFFNRYYFFFILNNTTTVTLTPIIIPATLIEIKIIAITDKPLVFPSSEGGIHPPMLPVPLGVMIGPKPDAGMNVPL